MLSFLLIIAIVFDGIGYSVFAKGNNHAKQGQQKNSSNVKQWLSEYEFYEDTRDAKIYEEVAIHKLQRFATIIKDMNLKFDSNALNNLDGTVNNSGDFKQKGSNHHDKFKQLIEQYEQAVQEEYIEGVVLKSDHLMKIKHQLTIYLWGYVSKNDFDKPTEVLISDILFNFYLSDKIANNNAIGILTDISDYIDHKGNKINAHLKNAVKMRKKANGFLEKELAIPAAKSYQNAYKQVLFGLEKAGYSLDAELFKSESDTDNDTVTDGTEFLEGMNPFKKDTDGDGLQDNIEYEYKSHISPTKSDTDQNGTSDANEDIDEDGLNNKEEQDHQTNLTKKDSDQDGLFDGFEVQEFDSLPSEYDTDGDGLSDGDEHVLKTDPNAEDSNGDGIKDSQELYKQTIKKSLPEQSEIKSVEVSFNAKDNITNTTRISSTKEVNFKTTNLHGIIGSPISINTQSEFDKASIKFTYDDSKLGDTLEDDLAIIRFNEGEEMMEDINSELDTSKNTISIETTQFGEYLVVDKTKFLELWEKEINYSTTNDVNETQKSTANSDETSSDVKINSTDSDGDGLYDTYEIEGMKTPYGIIYSDPNKKDSDGDGLTDGEEMGSLQTYTMELFGITFVIEGFFPTSFPEVKDSDGDGKFDDVDLRPLYADFTDLVIYQSNRTEYADENGAFANDLKINDYTGDELTDISWMFHFQLMEDFYLGSGPLFDEFEYMSTALFSTGDMEDVVLDMIDHFREGNEYGHIAPAYSNGTLTNEAFEHVTTKAYVNLVKNALVDELKRNGGNVAALQFDKNTKDTNRFYQYIQDNASYPVFNSWDDTINGLTITVNDTWGNTIRVKDFSVENNHFEGVMTVRLYDHFGLDRPDVEKKYVNLAGFRSWFVLQRYTEYNGEYKPFVTIMEKDIPFEGDLSN